MALRLAGACGYLAPDEAAVAARDVESVIRVLWVLAICAEAQQPASTK